MTFIDIKIGNKQKRIYMDNLLYKRIQQKIIPRIQKKDSDWVIVIDGPEGSGKSVFATQFGKVVDPSLDISRVCMTPEQFRNAIIGAKRGQCVIFDEAFTGLSSRAALSEINKLLVSLMMEMRQKNLFVIIVLPTFFMLEKYVALYRSKGLFHLYLKNGRRGRWMYFNNKKKKMLYLLGKKLFSYDRPKSNFRGKFFDGYTVDEYSYRKKKSDALSSKSRNTKSEEFKEQRDLLLLALKEKLGISMTNLSKLCKEYGVILERNTISEILHHKTDINTNEDSNGILLELQKEEILEETQV